VTLLGEQRTFDDLGAPLHEVPFCVIDLETTGGSAADCQITEIGAVKYVGGIEIGRFQTLVNPDAPIPPFITVLTGITHAMVVDAPRIGEALPSLLEFIGDSVIVGHNIRFDMSFLNAAAERMGYGRLRNKTSDTAAMARRLMPREVHNLRLGTLAAHFRSPVKPTHRALEDARATAHVFWSLLERAGAVGVTHLDDLLALPTARGSSHYGKLALTERLPRSPGVYLFVDRSGTVIYVGKAKNLRSRVRSYFYGDTRRSVAQMLRDLVRIEHRVCATELEAEITELRLISAHTPRYNSRSRPPKSPCFVKLTAERWPRLSLVRTLRDDGCLYLGPFRSRRAAERVITAIWDAVPIRRCTTRGGARSAACSFAQLGVARCPCDGDVTEAEYGAIVATLRTGIEHDPALLLDPLHDRMVALAASERFEEAADVRDRHRALASALQRRRDWQALVTAGRLWAEDAAGNGVVVEGGRLTAAWLGGGSPPLTADVGSDPATVPATVLAAEEAHLLWRWLSGPGVEIVDIANPVAMPARPVPTLQIAS
jgi:DNA polymerase III subunit epsilon